MAKRIFSIWLFAFVFIVCSAVALSVFKFKKEDPSPFKNLKIFTQIYNIVQARYVEPADANTLMEGAYRGAVESLFDQNSYIPENIMNKLNARETDGSSLGLKVIKRAGYAQVIFSNEDCEPFKNGIKPGSVLRKINGQNTFDMSAYEVSEMLKGKEGEKVVISFYSMEDGEEVDKEFTYSKEKCKASKTSTLETMKTFQLNDFDEKTVDLFKIYAQTADPVILDIRYNQSSNYKDMLDFASYLSGEKMTVTVKSRKGSNSISGTSKIHHNGTVFLLTSSYTMNAGAVFTELIKPLESVITVGSKTSGKAFSMELLQLENSKAYVHIASEFYSPLPEKGTKPEIKSYIDDDELEIKIKEALKDKQENGKEKKAA